MTRSRGPDRSVCAWAMRGPITAISALRAPSEDETRQIKALRLMGRARPEMEESVFSLPGGAKAVLHYPDVAEPAMPFTVKLDVTAAGSFLLVVDGQAMPIKPGTPLPVVLGGAEGSKELLLTRDGQKIGTAAVSLQAGTFFDAGPYTELFRRLQATIAGDRSIHPYRGGHIACNPTWVRDHVHEMKGYKFWEQDLTSYIDTLLSLQHPEGFFYEMLMPPENEHLTFVKPKHRLVDAENHIGWVPLGIGGRRRIPDGRRGVDHLAGHRRSAGNGSPAAAPGAGFELLFHRSHAMGREAWCAEASLHARHVGFHLWQVAQQPADRSRHADGHHARGQ